MKHFAIEFFLVLLLFAIPTSTLAQMPPLKPLKGTPAPSAPKNPEKFTFIVAGDNRPAHATDPQGYVVKTIFKEVKQLALKKQAPAFVLWTGDIIFGKDSSDPKTIDKQYAEFLAIAATGGAAVYNAPGNHEMNNKDNCPDDTMLKLYLNDTKQAQPYGSFDYGDSHFIALDSDEPAPPGDKCLCSSYPKGVKPQGYISAKQMKLLAGDLEANKTKAHIFIILHRPLVGYNKDQQLCPKNVSDMTALFTSYPNVSYVVAGHEHMYYNPQGDCGCAAPPDRTDPGPAPYYLVSGGAGAPLKKGGFFHYLIFTVDKAKVSVQLETVDSSTDVD